MIVAYKKISHYGYKYFAVKTYLDQFYPVLLAIKH